jgi:hypothetical protein
VTTRARVTQDRRPPLMEDNAIRTALRSWIGAPRRDSSRAVRRSAPSATPGAGRSRRDEVPPETSAKIVSCGPKLRKKASASSAAATLDRSGSG